MKFGIEGLKAYNETCRYARSKGLLVIGDIKRGDISSTASAYAAHLGGAQIGDHIEETWIEDAVTLNPYMGSDGIRPFLDICAGGDKGIFLLVKRAIPAAVRCRICSWRMGAEFTKLRVSWWRPGGAEAMGSGSYSNVGAVVGATHKEEGTRLRSQMPHTFFLVPGYGAQGGTAEDIAGFFR